MIRNPSNLLLGQGYNILVAVTAHLWKSAVDSSFSLLGWTTSYASLIIIVNPLNLIIILENATFYSVPLQSIISPSPLIINTNLTPARIAGETEKY